MGDFPVEYKQSGALTFNELELVQQVLEHFGGRDGLSPADFREVVPVTRKHLMPLLAFLDGAGITTRTGDLRAVRGVEQGERSS